MNFELDPPRGCGGLRLGMTRTDARAALEELGEVQIFARVSGSPPGWVVHRNLTVFVYCDSDGCLEAIEFGTPGHGGRGEDRVLYDGIDLFATPVNEVLGELKSRGLNIEVTEAGYSHTVPELFLSFWRDGGPRGEDELPLYYESVLVTAPGYGG